MRFVSFNFWQMTVPNYVQVDSDRHPYIYGQTYRELIEPIRELRTAAQLNPEIYQNTKIIVISRFTWPLPWYFGEFKKAGFFTEKNLPKSWDTDYLFVDSNLRHLVPADLLAKIEQNGSFKNIKSRQWASPMLVGRVMNADATMNRLPASGQNQR